MSKLIVRDKDGKVVQTVDNGKITNYDPDKHLDELCRFFGLPTGDK